MRYSFETQPVVAWTANDEASSTTTRVDPRHPRSVTPRVEP
jgi:hypothetical protein